MATIRPRYNKDGSTTWRVWIRRKGRPSITRSFSSEKEALEYIKTHEMHYALTGEIPEYDVLKERRLREMRYLGIPDNLGKIEKNILVS